ncbi:MAG: hypothetical protein LBE49_05210 [Deltaproteobacteria bacterium]|nr:hypothetical protein [Deltaproteobacteria bacterium]
MTDKLGIADKLDMAAKIALTDKLGMTAKLDMAAKIVLADKLGMAAKLALADKLGSPLWLKKGRKLKAAAKGKGAAHRGAGLLKYRGLFERRLKAGEKRGQSSRDER